jgi:hypothetical protein
MHSRLHLPLFILTIPFCTVMLNTKTVTTTLVLLPLVIVAILCTLLNINKPVSPWHDSVFKQSRKELYTNKNATYQKVSAYIGDCQWHNVGLKIGVDGGDYLFWVFLKASPTSDPIRIKHVNVNNPSGKIHKISNFTPDCLISTTDSSETLTADTHIYLKKKRVDFCYIYQRKN